MERHRQDLPGREAHTCYERVRAGFGSRGVCREAGGRVTVNVRVQEMDLLPLRQVDNRRLEVVVDGLPFFRGAQLAIDTHDGLSDPPRRNNQETMRLDQRSCVAAGTKARREDLPRARWGHGAGQIGGAQLRGRGKVVH